MQVPSGHDIGGGDEAHQFSPVCGGRTVIILNLNIAVISGGACSICQQLLSAGVVVSAAVAVPMAGAIFLYAGVVSSGAVARGTTCTCNVFGSMDIKLHKII